MTDLLSRLNAGDLHGTLWPFTKAGIYLAGAGLLSLITIAFHKRFTRYYTRLIRERGGSDSLELEKQAATVTTIARRVTMGLIWTIATALALQAVGLDVAPLLAGAGVAGIAIGFAAQNLLKDWISGFFLLTDGNIRMNDILKIGDLSGVVEKITLRNVALRGYDGALHVISNGSINSFTNLTLNHSFAVFDVPIEYSEQPERMIETMKEIGAAMQGDELFGPMILEPLEIAGVDKFVEAGVIVKSRIKTLPGQQWTVGREFLRRLKAACDKAGIKIATAQRAVQLFEDGSPWRPS